MTKEIKIEFAEGCFDNFDGTQEELDELMAEITQLAESGELFERSNPINIDDLDDDELEELVNQLAFLENGSTTKRTLQ